ncbi:MAG: T9SS type A sorting domain-containing protein [Bacteroidia bacterium]
MTTTNNSLSKNFFVKAAFTLWFACIATIGFASDYYWVGGTGNWSDYGTHWATSSGGVIFHTTVPGPADDVYFDANSFPTIGDTLFPDTTIINCHDMDWTGVMNNPTLNSGATLKIYGSLTLASGISFSSNLLFKSPTSGNTITTAGLHLNYVTFDNISGGWILNDSLNAFYLTIGNGTFTSNNQNIYCDYFYAGNQFGSSKATVSLGSSIVTCKSNWQARDTSNLILDAVSANIIVTDSSSLIFSNHGFSGGTYQVYGDVTSHIVHGSYNSYHNVYLFYEGTIDGSNNTFNDVFFLVNGGFGSINSTVHNIFFSGSGSIGGPNNINKAVFSEDATINGSTFDTLIISNPGKTIAFGGITTINNVLTITVGSCNSLSIIKSTQTGVQATLNKPNGIVPFDYAQIQDINAIGGATFTAANSIDGGNVTGITINSPAPKNLYWVGGSGNWNDPAHWATSSGGTGNNCIPAQVDNVFFDANSFISSTDTVSVPGIIIYCHNIDWTGTTKNPVFQNPVIGGGRLKVSGSLTLISAMKWSCAVEFVGNTQGNTITTGGQLIVYVTINNPTGSWMLTDSLEANIITVSKGTFNSNNNFISCVSFYAGDFSQFITGSTVLLGTSTIMCSKWVAHNAPDLTLDADSAIFIISPDTNPLWPIDDGFLGGNNHIYNDITCNHLTGDSNVYHNINFSYSGYCDGTYNSFNDVYCSSDFGFNEPYSQVNNIYFNGDGAIAHFITINKAIFNANATINNGNQFDTLIFNNPGKNIKFNGTNTINNLLSFGSGTCASLTHILSGTAGVQAIVNKSSGTVNLDYALIQDINAAGGGTFIANNSIDGGNVTGITINAPTSQNLYWVGGSGNWNDSAHWATSSGGIGNNCVPTQYDNVFFDANSFSSSADTVSASGVIIYCHNIDWSGAINNPVFQNPVIGGGRLKVSGSFTLKSGMNWSGAVEFVGSTQGNTITTGGQYIRYATFDNPTGGWILNDSIHNDIMSLRNGTFDSNNHSIYCNSFYAGTSSGNSKAKALLGTSVITCKVEWQAQDTSHLILDAALANIIITDSAGFIMNGFKGGSNQVYGDVTCNMIHGNYNAYHNVYLPYEGDIFDNHNTFNDVFFLKDGGFGCNNSTIHNIFFSGNGSIAGPNVISKAVFVEDANIFGSTFDTLIINNPGKTITFGGAITVNNELIIANGLPGFPTSVHSSLSGMQATISLPSDTLCTDYLYLQDINVAGGAVFYAGNYSVDLGNNSGWQWIGCALDTSNVWPGDANYDLAANNLDLLYVGLGYGYTGTTRAGASNVWIAQPSVDWLQQFANGINLKNADCNGDGTIDNNDTTAIGLNYGLTHPFKNSPPPPNPNQTGTPFYLVPSIDTVGLNYNVNIDIYLGTSTLTVNNAYGIAFTLNFTQGIIDTSQVTFDYTNSMLGNPGVDMMTFNKEFVSSGSIDFALTRTDHNNISGFGFLGRCGIVIVDNVGGVTAMQLNLTNITAFDKNEFPLTFNPIGDSIVIDTNLVLSAHQIDLSQFISVYPNPAKDHLKINGGLLNLKTVELFDMMGTKIFSSTPNAHSTEINTQKINQGLYVLRCITDKGIINRRVQVLKY